MYSYRTDFKYLIKNIIKDNIYFFRLNKKNKIIKDNI
jgi:hypothetical protein